MSSLNLVEIPDNCTDLVF